MVRPLMTDTVFLAQKALPADAGEIRLGSKVHIGYYDQEHQVLHMEKTIFEEISDAYPSMTQTEIRNVLAAFLFTGDEVFAPVSTLSGGESFETSLALALGLAEVVQQNAGGIQIQTMFVDEGFGSLDPQSLDSAIQTLTGLREEGRLVGIISHVPQLYERIPARIVVTPSINGSSAKISFADGEN